MALAAPPISERKRVKVYELRENDWFDRGTGFCAVQTINNEGRISVESEDEPERSLLEVKVKKEDNYQKQQDTLIVWTDPDGIDMALSFQEAEGCGIVWTTISEVQQRLQVGNAGNQMTLPPPELRNLVEIEVMIRGAGSTQQGRDTLSKLIVSENYLANLTPLVGLAEDFEDLPDLHRLCNIMKTLILLNDHAIIEYVVRDDIIFGVVGALEYDPDFPNHKANHRQYLSDESKYKEVVRIQDEDIRRKIHFTYRLQYLKDVVLARILDDPTFSVLNSLIYFHQIDIVQHITSNTTFITELFAVINDPTESQQKKKEAVIFVQQCCAVAKPFTGPTRAQLYTNFVSFGLFPTIVFALSSHDAAVRVAGTDILVAVIDHDVTMIRNYIYKAVSDNGKPLTDTLIELLLVESDLGVKAQVADAIKVLLEPIASSPPDRNINGESALAVKLRNQVPVSQQNENFLQAFFDKSAKKLFQPLKELENRKSMSGFSIHEISLYSHLVEILCFFVRQHSYRSKSFILSESIAARTAQLMACPEKHMKLTVIKYFRAVITLQDEHHNRQIIKHNLFEPMLSILVATMPRDNLLNSACLDLFDYICKESIRQLIIPLVEAHRETLYLLTSVDIFGRILSRYEQLINPMILPSQGKYITGDVDSSFMTSEVETPNTRHITINGGGTRWQGLRDTDADEEAYFNASDGEDDDEDELSRDGPPTPMSQVNGASPMSKPLVDYADDDDDDDLPPLPTSSPLLAKQQSQTFTPEESSSSPSPTPSILTPNSSTSPTPPKVPLSSIAEKRRREEDDDEDELGKLSTHTSSKRRNSSIAPAPSTLLNATKTTQSPQNQESDARSIKSPPSPSSETNPPEQPPSRSAWREGYTPPPIPPMRKLRDPVPVPVPVPVQEELPDSPPSATPMTRSGTLRKRKAFGGGGKDLFGKDNAVPAATTTTAAATSKDMAQVGDGGAGAGAGAGGAGKKIIFHLGSNSTTPTASATSNANSNSTGETGKKSGTGNGGGEK